MVALAWVPPGTGHNGRFPDLDGRPPWSSYPHVVLVDVDAVAYPEGHEPRRRLHVGATRAVHQIWLTTVGTPSPLVRDLVTVEG